MSKFKDLRQASHGAAEEERKALELALAQIHETTVAEYAPYTAMIVPLLHELNMEMQWNGHVESEVRKPKNIRDTILPARYSLIFPSSQISNRIDELRVSIPTGTGFDKPNRRYWVTFSNIPSPTDLRKTEYFSAITPDDSENFLITAIQQAVFAYQTAR